jgi:hypothetical protein
MRITAAIVLLIFAIIGSGAAGIAATQTSLPTAFSTTQ